MTAPAGEPANLAPKTKVVCTIGPATRSESQLRALIEAGMSVARLNFAHGSHEEHLEVLRCIRRLAEELAVPLPILQDLAGPKVRVGEFEKGGVTLEAGASFTLTARKVLGNSRQVSVTYDNLPKEVKGGDKLLLADGSIELEVETVSGPDIRCRVVFGGYLGSRKGVNSPSGLYGLPILGEKDLQDLRFGLENGVDLVGLSFVRSAQDVRTAKETLAKLGSKAPLIAKIETHAALENYLEILQEADGIMIARGDLSIETPFTRVPVIQKQLISEAIHQAKPVITATQMLWSMVRFPQPSRAEVADVANAILDGSDAVMLSEETTVGRYPVRAVATMVSIARETESAGIQAAKVPPKGGSLPEAASEATAEGIARAACDLAARLRVDVIGTVTFSGQTARLVAKFRPEQPILAVTNRVETYRALALVRGVIPMLLPEKIASTEELMSAAFRVVRERGWQGSQAIFVGTDRVRKGVI